MKRVDMDSIISHPWINFGNLPPLIRKAPAIAKIGDDVLLSHVIKSISHENGMVVYHFNPLQSKRNSLPVGSLDDNKRNGLSGRSALQSPTERKSIVISSQANDLQNIIPPKSNRRFSFQEIPDRNGEVNQTPRKSGIFGISEENAHSGPKFQSTDSSISAVTNKLSGPSSRRPSITVRSENDFGVVEMKQILPEDSDIPEDPSIPEVSDIPEGSVIPEPSKKVAQTDSNTNIILPKSQSLPVKKMRSYSHSSKGKIFKSEELKSSDVPIPKRGRRATLTFLETNSSKIVPVAAVPMDRENAVLRRMSMVGPSKKEASSENNTGSLNNSNTIEDSLSALDKTINIEDIMSFHTIHKPPKTIRTMRFSFNRAGSSNRDPATMFQDLHQSLIKYSRIDGINLKYQRHEDYYLFTCKQLDSNGNIIVSFEAEICKVWLLNLHALRTRRMTGEFCHFKEAYHQILSELGWG
ncbi:hypothetical protein BC833DRAFT_583818 [Globomyces pollinis-pini]|nr:hypothetical protein BC833DRAFT_583818 [Globomyces pollinis-pini]